MAKRKPGPNRAKQTKGEERKIKNQNKEKTYESKEREGRGGVGGRGKKGVETQKNSKSCPHIIIMGGQGTHTNKKKQKRRPKSRIDENRKLMETGGTFFRSTTI